MKKIITSTLFLCVIIFTGCQKAEITETKAAELAKLYLESIGSEEFIKTITNFDAPDVEKLDFAESYFVCYFNAASPQELDLLGKKIWKVTYTTPFDNRLGPFTIYLDRNSGEVYGSDLRQ
jgi:hypothetical protein